MMRIWPDFRRWDQIRETEILRERVHSRRLPTPTDRELTLLIFLGQGESEAAIARRLHYRLSVVAAQTGSMRTKLQFSSTAELASFAAAVIQPPQTCAETGQETDTGKAFRHSRPLRCSPAGTRRIKPGRNP